MVPSAVVAVALLAGGALLAAKFPHRGWRLAALSLILATPLALIGFWYSTGSLGISDWDYYFSYHHVLRTMLLEHNAFPFWNPYTCGGTAGLGDPEFPLFAPTFLFEIVFGVPAGLRIAIMWSVALTAVGMLLLAKRLKLSVAGALIAALAGAFGSVSLLEIVEGHPNVFAAAWLPWVFWAWVHAYGQAKHKAQNTNPKQSTEHRSQKHELIFGIWNLCFGILRGRQQHTATVNYWPLICGILLALMFFQGGIYLLSYTALAFLTLILLLPRRRAALMSTLQAGAWALALTAIKLIPVLLWLNQFQDAAYASSTYTLPHLHEILLTRRLHGAGDIIPNQGSGWHEYGAYIGLPVLLLAVAGLMAGRRQRSVRILAIGALLALLLSSAGPLLKPFFDAAPFIPRSNISRIILFAVLPLSLLAGFGLDALTQVQAQQRGFRSLSRVALRGGPPAGAQALRAPGGGAQRQDPRPRRIRVLIVTIMSLVIVAADLFTLANALSYQAFVLPEVYPVPSPAPSPLAYITHTYETRYNGHDYTRSYAAARAGYGTLSYCTVLSPEPAVRTIHDESDKDIITVSSKTAAFTLLDWSPNEVTAQITSEEPTDVLLNTNYAAGWQIIVSPPDKGGSWQPARDIAGRVGVRVSAGQHAITFRYRTPGFIPGLIITAAAILIAALVISGNLKTHGKKTKKP